ncbi:hypothetical protein OsI_27929 [Oryza sativa Indica Group]|nr:hypothetical protein OsI_27929 [Oryza sativa Indica Group]
MRSGGDVKSFRQRQAHRRRAGVSKKAPASQATPDRAVEEAEDEGRERMAREFDMDMR